MNQDELKRQAAEAALEYLPDGGVLGIGTGSTVNHFIDLLADVKNRYEGAVSSSEASTERLKAIGMPVFDLNAVGELEIYVDGADESNHSLHLIKGGGGALTREKIIAAASKKFVCIADESKLVHVLGKFPLPVEVIPMARSYVARGTGEAGRHPRVAGELHYRQWQHHSRRREPGNHGAGETGDRDQPDRRRGHCGHLWSSSG